MREICARGVVTLVACVLALPAAHAEVLFQNTGNLRTVEQSDRRSGWERVYTQQMGSITVVPSPAFQGGEAVRAFQRYLASGDGRYHSEVVKFDIQQDGQDLYYGHAIYLPANWQFHGDNVTFQQWGLENPGGGAPWILMFVINDQLRVAGVRRAGFGTHTIAPITDLRGTWIRVVTRIRMGAPGNFEVWVNGKKSLSLTPANLTGDGAPPTIRWAAGIYCTEWVNQAPLGMSSLEILHDHFRIATTYDEAEPANWRDDNMPPGPDGGTDVGGGDAAADSGDVVANAPEATDAAGGGGGSGGGGSGGTGGSASGGGSGGSGTAGTGGVTSGGRGAGGSGGAGGTTAAASSGGCGCRLAGGTSPGGRWVIPLIALMGARLLRRRRGR
jgi:MYXO-CTERM domain-containing protein